MTDYATANEAFAQRFSDVWTPTGFPFALGNEKFVPPDSTPWARMVVRHAAATQSTLGPDGSRQFDRIGSLIIQIFTPSPGNTRQSSELIQTIVNGFEGERIVGTSICFNDIIPREIGPDDKWYQVNIEAEFIYTDIR